VADDGDNSDDTGDGEPVVVPARRGRRPGSKNKRTVEVELALRPMLPRAKRKLAELLQSDDPETAYKALALTFGYIFGKPTERVSAEVSGPDGQPIQTQELGYDEAARRIAFLLVAGREKARAEGAPSLQVIEGDAEPRPVYHQPEPAPAPQPRSMLSAYTPPPPDDPAALAAANEERIASMNEHFMAERQRHPRHVVITKRNR
jgi:hypothetical protein